MAFDKEDYKRGNIGQERLREIVHETIFKIDYKRFDPEALERVKSILADIVAKIIYKKNFQAGSDNFTQNSTGENDNHLPKVNGVANNPTEKKRFDEKIEEHKTAIYIQRCFEFMSLMEHHKELEGLKSRLDAEVRLLDYLKEKDLDKYLKEVDFQNKIFADRIEMLIQQIKEDTRAYIENLHKSMSTREGVIRAARKFHADNIIQQADNIIVDGKKFFEGMDNKQIETFVDGRLACMEYKERKLLELEFQRDQALEQNKMMSANNNSGSFLPQSNKDTADARVLNWFNDEKLKLERVDINNLRRVAQESGVKLIDPTADDATFMKQIRAYDNNSIVRLEQDQFKNIVRHEGRQIIIERNLANKAQAVHDRIQNTNDRSVQAGLVDELLKQANASVIRNDSVQSLLKENELNSKEIKDDARVEVFITSNQTDPNHDASDGLDIKGSLQDSESAIQDDREILKETNDSEFDDIDFESMGIEIDGWHDALQTTFEEIGAVSISGIESMNEIDFSSLRASPTLENKGVNEAHSKRVSPI